MMEKTKMTPGIQLLFFFFLLFFMSSVGELVYGVILAIFTNIDVNTTDFTAPYMQLSRMFVVTVFGYFMAFYLFLKFTNQKFKELFFNERIKIKYIIISIGILFTGMIIMSYLQEFNEGLKYLLPDNSFIEIQVESREMMDRLLDNNNPLQLLFTILVAAVIPAIVEELVFRGLLIGKLMESTGKIHFSVMISAIIFAGVHFQPLNLLPIMFMGICFGYIYVYFKNIRYTILLHFLNNLAVVLIPFFT